jgi:hypothetical protein
LSAACASGYDRPVAEHHRVERVEAQTRAVPSATALSARTPASVALALQRTVGNRATVRLLQREVRIDAGRTRVDEAFYKTGGGRNIGTRRRVADLIDDPVRRVFRSDAELRDFANGRTDYIGDVVTRTAGTFWFRLPRDRMTVLGEQHENPAGNVEDVIIGLGTPRFMYEPFNYVARVGSIGAQYGGTEVRLAQVNRTYRVNSLVDRSRYGPELENVIVKAMVGAAITRNEYLVASRRARAGSQWRSRPSTNDWSYGERAALYLSLAVHIASDVSGQSLPAAARGESPFTRAARRLQAVYTTHQTELDALMQAKDADDLIGIFELTAPNNFANVGAIRAFATAFHEFGSRYIEQLGIDTHNVSLEREGRRLHSRPRAGLEQFSAAREEIMWQNIELARLAGIDYLIVGMGDAHRVSLAPRLNRAGIPHFRVERALADQQAAVNRDWVP